MRELLRTMGESHEASVRIALDAAGIPAVFQPNAWSAGGASKYWSAVLVDDDEYDRAATAIASVRQTPISDSVELPLVRWLRWGIALAIAGAVVWRLWLMIAER